METTDIANPALHPAGSIQGEALRDSVYKALENYFANLDGIEPSKLFQIFQTETEEPLFRAVMDFTKNNQSRAARILGISRGTLRKKLKQYGLL